MKKAFDSKIYFKLQSEEIKRRIDMFGGKLYMEFGGKLFDDYNVSRIFPGFEPNLKLKVLQDFKDDVEVIFCINAGDIEKNKIRADHGITYDLEILRLIKELKKLNISVNSVVITLYTGQPAADKFRRVLEDKNIKTYIHNPTKGYPVDVDLIVSDEGYGKNSYIETTKKLVVVTSAGANSGKLATCLSQLYHEYKRGNRVGYAKFETLPVWNLPLKHMVNIEYEVSTADVKDINMIDPFHMDAYNENTVNYNRDIATFPILKNILNSITGEDIYKSPTDMGINMIKFGITDENTVIELSKQEIIRRYYAALCDLKRENTDNDTVERIKTLMDETNILISDRKVIKPALEKSKLCSADAVALELSNGKIITGRRTDILSPVSAVIINAIKEINNISDNIHLLSPTVLEPTLKMKQKPLYGLGNHLEINEVFITLSICSVTNPMIVQALSKLDELRDCQLHSSYMLPQNEIHILKNLGIQLTCEPEFSKNLS